MNTKETLLKHGVLPTLINEGRIHDFERYVQEAASGQNENFKSFTDIAVAWLRAPKLRLLEITETAEKSLERAANVLEKLSPTIKESLFSSFSGTYDISELKARHFNSVIALDREAVALKTLGFECAAVTKNADYSLLTELTLRKIALLEYSHDTELIKQYELLANEAHRIFGQEAAGEVLKKAGVIQNASSEILKFITESALALEALEKRNTSQSVLDTIIRKYQSIIHGILLKLREI